MLSVIILMAYGGDESNADDFLYTDNRDGQVYRTVEISDLTWMIDNMNYSGKDLGWVYRDDQSFEPIYGRMNDWWMTPQVCPEGW